MTTAEDLRVESSFREQGFEFTDKPEGPISAAILAGGIGCLTLGIFTTLAEANSSVKDWLQWSDRVGPLSGKTAMTVIIWLAAWTVLHVIYRNKPFETHRALIISLVLITLGAVGTFPTFFQAFG